MDTDRKAAAADAPVTARRRAREKENRRAAILAAAREMFFTAGYARTTIPDIARAAELAPGTLYLYFAGKDAIYAELLAEGYDALEARLAAADNPNAAPRRRAEALIDAFFSFAHESPQYFDIIFFLAQRETGAGQRDNLAPEQAQRIEAREASCRAVAARALGAAPGLRSRRAAQAGFDAAWSMLVGVVSYWNRDEGFSDVAAAARRILLDAFFPGERR